MGLERGCGNLTPRGYKFSTYAYWWIHAITHALMLTHDPVADSHHGKLNKIKKVQRELAQQLGRSYRN